MTVRTSAQVRAVLVAYAVSCTGTGLVLPFTAIYLNSARELGAAAAAVFFGLVAGTSLVSAPFAGRLADQWGPRPTCVAGITAQACGYLTLAVATTQLRVAATAALVGIGNALFHSSFAPVIARMVDEGSRRRAFSIRYFSMNVGLGVGAAVGAWLVGSGTRVEVYQLLYALNAASYVPILVAVVHWARGAVRAPRTPGAADGSYALLLRTRGLVLLLITQTLLVLFGYAQLDSAVPVVLTDDLGLTPRLVGVMIVANTVSVVLLQLTLGRILERFALPTVLLFCALTWAVANAVGLLASLAAGGGQIALAIGFGVVFAVGEVCFGASYHALLTDVAPPAVLGRANALSSVSWNVGAMGGPAVGLIVIAALPTAGYWIVCGILLLAAAATAGRLRRLVPRPVPHDPAMQVTS